MKVAVCRKEHFSSAHRLFNPDWSDKKNEETFGRCNNLNGHGHNYEFVVRLVGEPDPETGFVYDLKHLSDLMIEHVVDKFDHKNLNLDVENFKNLNPTAENIVIVIYNILREKIDAELEMEITLYETERNFVEYPV